MASICFRGLATFVFNVNSRVLGVRRYGVAFGQLFELLFIRAREQSRTLSTRCSHRFLVFVAEEDFRICLLAAEFFRSEACGRRPTCTFLRLGRLRLRLTLVATASFIGFPSWIIGQRLLLFARQFLIKCRWLLGKKELFGGCGSGQSQLFVEVGLRCLFTNNDLLLLLLAIIII